MPLDPRTPVIVGAAQQVQRLEDAAAPLDPLGMMECALREAAEDAGNLRLLSALDGIVVPRGTWKYGDPGALLAERVGATRPRTGLGALSGHTVQVLIDWACREVADGRLDVVAVVGGESENSKRRMARQEIALPWSDEVPGEPDHQIGDRSLGILEHEWAAGIFKATTIFALCETSLRHAKGETPALHRDRIAEIQSGMSEVAASNPNAWIQRHVSGDEIRNVSESNRLVSYPYTKLMTSNISVDQGAALIVCSTEAADRYGISSNRRVYPRAATEMHHLVHLSERVQLHEHPGMEIAGRRILEAIDRDISQIRHIDLYSCFPFAVQAGSAALGIEGDRPVTVTGGLTFSGGPFGNYVLQATARMVELLRADPEEFGLVGSIGGCFAKFAFGAYSCDPGDGAPMVTNDVSDVAAAEPLRSYRVDHAGEVEVESYTVEEDRSGSRNAVFSALTGEGERVWARSEDRDWLEALVQDEEACGQRARVNEGLIELA
ncbi:hypothetical protein MK489_09745 [Myxococcota bacterium]|nr:hypothetical protein [Myxococcota bacterium]